MDPITTAILAALTAGTLGGITETSKTMIADGYSQLKSLLVRKYGTESAALQAINSLETEPASSACQVALSKALTAVKADEDREVRTAAQLLSSLVPIQQTGTGKYTRFRISVQSACRSLVTTLLCSLLKLREKWLMRKLRRQEFKSGAGESVERGSCGIGTFLDMPCIMLTRQMRKSLVINDRGRFLLMYIIS